MEGILKKNNKSQVVDLSNKRLTPLSGNAYKKMLSSSMTKVVSPKNQEFAIETEADLITLQKVMKLTDEEVVIKFFRSIDVKP